MICVRVTKSWAPLGKSLSCAYKYEDSRGCEEFMGMYSSLYVYSQFVPFLSACLFAQSALMGSFSCM